jgi:uncharacterized protein (DUF433 family)
VARSRKVNSDVLGRGVYTFWEAGRLIGIPSRKVRAWFCGRPSRPESVVHSDYRHYGFSSRVISFYDLIDTLVIARLREAGVSFQYLRRAHSALITEFSTPHPLCQKNLLTDGRKVFIHIADQLGEEQLRELITRQQAFPTVLLPTLNRVDYDPDSLLASRWNIGAGVVIDPFRQYGKPVVDSTGIPTSVLAAAYESNRRNAVAVADWYGVKPKHVMLSVEFEEALDKTAA